jgi:hypothetical protein
MSWFSGSGEEIVLWLLLSLCVWGADREVHAMADRMIKVRFQTLCVGMPPWIDFYTWNYRPAYHCMF